MRAQVDHGLQMSEVREALGARQGRKVRECAGRGQRRVHERVGRVNDDAVAVADRRLDLADRARVAERIRHVVGELELRAVLVLDEHHDLRAIVFFEQKGQRLRRDERCRRRRRDARHEAEEVPRRVRLS